MEQPTYYHSVTLERGQVQGLHDVPEALPHRGHPRPRAAARTSSTSAASTAASASASAPTTPRSPSRTPFPRFNRLSDTRSRCPRPRSTASSRASRTSAACSTPLIAIGFDDVYEVARGAEYRFARDHRARGASQKSTTACPLISSACPAVVRLIQVRFPELLDNVVDVISPHGGRRPGRAQAASAGT